MGLFEILLIAVPCGTAAIAFIYGFIRKFSRVTWIGWQILLLFALTFLLDAIPPLGDGFVWFALVAGVFLLAVLLLFGVEWLVRRAALKSRPGKGVRILGRFCGAFSAIAAVLVLEAVLFGLVLAVADALPSPPAFFASALQSGVWVNFLGKHAYDLFVLSMFFVFVRAGLRLGLLRALYYLLMFALTFACFWGSILLATKVGFLDGWGDGIAGAFSSLPEAGASVLGHGIIAFVCFLILFTVCMLFGALLHWLIRKFISIRAIGLIDGLILCLLYAAVFLAIACAFHYGVTYLVASTAGIVDLPIQFGGIGEVAETVVRSAPFARALYDYNPFAFLLR